MPRISDKIPREEWKPIPNIINLFLPLSLRWRGGKGPEEEGAQQPRLSRLPGTIAAPAGPDLPAAPSVGCHQDSQ